jgi:hypothetical protein
VIRSKIVVERLRKHALGVGISLKHALALQARCERGVSNKSDAA